MHWSLAIFVSDFFLTQNGICGCLDFLLCEALVSELWKKHVLMCELDEVSFYFFGE
jgi:hypothetical protein